MLSRGDLRRMMSGRTLLLDGAYGTSFFEMGHTGALDLLNITHPDDVVRVHAGYIDAGADMILTNTFGANRFKLAEVGADSRLAEINAAGVRAARRAADAVSRPVLVLGDMSSTGALPRPSGDGDFASCREAYREQAAALIEAGVDAVIIETMTDIKEMRAAMIGVRDVSDEVPMIAQMAFDSTGSTLTGASIEVFAAVAEDLGADVIGMNCLVGPDSMVRNIRRLSAATRLPLSAEPNAGDPIFDGDRTVYPVGAVEFASYAEEMVELGVSVLGGCCGTTAGHIRALAAVLRGAAPAAVRPREVQTGVVVTSRTSCVRFESDERFVVIGERVNPTGRKELSRAMRAGDWSAACAEAETQEREGADVIDVNFGVERYFTAESVRDAYTALDLAVNAPISIDIQTIELMETALEEYPGRALINSCACDRASLDAKLPLMKRYGGVMILLAMDGEIADIASERVAAVERALAYAMERFSLPADRFVIDPLVMSVGAGSDPSVTLEVIEECSKRGWLTTMGLSNLSHGMPNRSGINSAFVSRAVSLGASSAIMNPGDAVVMQTMYGAMTLKTGRVEQAVSRDEMSPIVAALLAGRTKELDRIADEELAGGATPMEVSTRVLGGAMEAIGALYESKKIFLPHILFAAETAFPIFDRLNAMMPPDATQSRGSVLLATVEGDIHDIGKNIVATVLRAGGFKVTDMGKNVRASDIVSLAREIDPDIIGLSAMMTTTVGRVREVREAAEAEGVRARVICGGASMTEELAAMFGAAYSSSSSGALALCRSIVEKIPER